MCLIAEREHVSLVGEVAARIKCTTSVTIALLVKGVIQIVYGRTNWIWIHGIKNVYP